MLRKLLLLLSVIFYLSLTAQEDCISAITVCGNSNINYTPSGIGNINENLGGCLSHENHSVWYKFTIATSGTLTFDITPTGPVDYDWAVYGPNVTCSNRGTPIRCNASGDFGPTGLNMTSTLTTVPGGLGNPRYCRFMDVLAGQTYYLYIDNWSTTVYTFNLTWGGTATFASPFNNSSTAPNPFIPPGTPGPNANSPREISICNNTALFDFSTLSTGILNGNSNFTVSYFNSANNATTGSNPIITPITVNTTSTYYYSISYHDPNNPNNVINACRQINPLVFRNRTPTATITSPTTVLCPGGSITLTTNNATGNTWSTGATTQSINVTAPGTYTVTAPNGNCTSSPASITITSESNPNIQITGNLSFCESTSTQITASANGTGNTYTWSTGATTPAITISSPGTYTVTVKTPAGCQYTKSVVIAQDALPVVQNSNLDQCSNTASAVFNLTSAQPNISSTPGVTFDYYTNQVDALAGNSNTIANPSAYTSGNAVVYVRVKSATCFKVAQLQLTITQLPAPTITTSSTTICYGGNITLTSGSTTGNLWSTGATTQSITVTTPGTYTVTTSNGSCTSTPATVTLTAENDPNIQITGNLTLCESTSTQITASANGTGNIYTWSTGATTPSITITTPGTYTVTVKTPAGCQYTKSVVITQGIVPNVQNSSLSQCSDTSSAVFNLISAQTNISSTPGVTFDYYTNQTDALAGNSNTIANPSAYTSGNAVVYVRVKSATCFKVAQLQLTITQLPAPTITTSSTTICYGGNATLTSGSTTGNLWSTGATTQSITVTTPGTYTVTTSNGNCISTPASVIITAENDPNIQINGNLILCQGAQTSLTATAQGTGNSYTWSNGTSGPTNTISSPGTYTVTVKTPSGCQYQKSVIATAAPPITINITPPEQITCTGSQITLNASASIYQPGATFVWTTNGGTIVSGANTLTPIVNNSGTYTLTITNLSPASCTAQASVTVIKNTTPPVISVSAPKLTICKGESVILTASGAASYTWTGIPGNTNTQTISPTSTTTYTVTGTGSNGCPAQIPASITIKVVPEIVSTLQSIEICSGDKAILDTGSGPNYTYKWSTGATTQTINVTLAGTYTVIINNGICSNTFTATVNYIKTPEILDISFKDHILTINIKNNGSLPAEYSIDGGVTWQSSNIFTNALRNTLYSIKVRNRGALCETSTTYYTFFIANVITPNHDGINDVINFSEISKYGNFEGNIFDRYGTAIFKVSSKNPIWNGTYLDRPLPTGTYWYSLSWEDRISKKSVQSSGWILLKNRD